MQRDFYASNLPPTARFVAVTLAWHHNEQTGRCDPSLPLLAQETGLCIRAVRQALRTIEAAGHISSIPRPGGTPLYRLHPTTPAADAAHPGTTCPPAGNAPRHQMPPTPAPHAAPPRHHMPPTPAPHAAKLERTGTGTGKEPNSYAPPMATPEGDDWLDDFEIPEPAPKAAPTPPPAPQPTPAPEPKPSKPKHEAEPEAVAQKLPGTPSPELAAAWEDWQQYRQQRACAKLSADRIRWTALAARTAANQIVQHAARLGDRIVCDRIASAISGEWRGMNLDKLETPKQHDQPHFRSHIPTRNGTSQPLPQAEGLNRDRLPPKLPRP